MTHRACWMRLIVVVATLFVSASAAWACDISKRPPAGTNNVWFCYRNSDTAIVFVHGILSDSSSAWYNETSKTYWPALIADDATIGDAAIFLGGYPTDVISNEFDLDGAVDTLYVHLRNFMDNRQHKPVTQFKRIVFIAHSLGGVVVRRLLMQHPDEFQDQEIGLVLLGSPSKGSNFADLLEPMAVALSIKNNMLEVLKWNSAWLRTFHDDFKRLIADRRLPKLAGIELFEANPIGGVEGFQAEGWVGRVKAMVVNKLRADTILAQPIVPLASAGEYWDAVHPVGNTDHFSLVKPLGPNDDVYVQVINFYANVMTKLPPPGCDPPPSFKVLIEAPMLQQQLVPISIIRDADDLPGDADNDPIEPQKSNNRYTYLPDPPFPCPGQKLKAWITRAPGSEGSRAATEAEQQPWSLCFKRSQAPERKDSRFAKIDCRTPVGDKCVVPVNPAQSGMADSCEESGSLDWVGFAAAAQSAETAENATIWVTPALDSILKQPADERRSYVEFRLVADDLLDLGKATHYEVEVQVNGRVLYFDGWPPERLRKRYSGKGPLVIDFALDSLNMTGENSGYEAIRVVIRLFADKERLSTLISQRPYASYRHYEDPYNSVMEALTSDVGGNFRWSGTFRPSSGQDRFAVMLLSRPFKDDLRRILPLVTRAKERLDGLGLRFKAQAVIGRLYPPRPTLNTVGLAFALAHDEGRVSVAFPFQEARAICKYVARQLNRLVAKGVAAPDAFIYDFDPALFAAGGDRPRGFAPCKGLK